MTDNKPSTAIVQYGALKEMLANPEMKERFEQVLGKRAGAFVGSLLNTVYTNDNLKECDPNSIITAAMNAAVLDLQVDPALGFSWIIPYREKGFPKARFQIGYKGLIQLALRTGQYKIINAAEVFEGEEVKENRLTGKIELNGEPTSEKVIGYVFYFQMISGYEKYFYRTTEQILAHAKKYSKSFNHENSIWKTHFREMAFKTVITLGLKKWALLTTETSRDLKLAMELDTEFQDVEEVEIVDSTVVEYTPEPQVEPQPLPREEVIDVTSKPAPQVTEKPDLDPKNDDLIGLLVTSGLLTGGEYQARNLLANYIPAHVKTNKKALLKWVEVYMAWRGRDVDAKEAVTNATNGVLPEGL